MPLIGGENNLKHLSTQKVDTFYNSCDVACLKFKLHATKQLAI